MSPINSSAATASLRLTLQPGFGSLHTQQTFTDSEIIWGGLFTQLCDFVEDYRSSTIFDVLGSVGGLFALLQSVHILLFGRPLLWGLTGKHVSHEHSKHLVNSAS